YTKTQVDTLLAENRTAVRSDWISVEETGTYHTEPFIMPRAGIIKNIYIYTAEISFSGSVTLTFTINDVDTALTFPVTTGSASISYSQDGTLVLAAGDLCGIHIDQNVDSGYKEIFISFEY
ncbi:MAG: hypothetical protein JXJ04_17705, partial [Spirochaetales bacterium]|nr:hypothetical protein [Spirochaetales bacterium]